MLALLAEDLAHIEPSLLERAINRHVAASPYMPKAAELIAVCQSMVDPRETIGIDCEGPTYSHDLARAYNRRLEKRDRKLSDVREWAVAESGELKFIDRGSRGSSTRWEPIPGEIEATRAVTAELVAKGVDPNEFSAMVRNGIVTRLVEQRLSAR